MSDLLQLLSAISITARPMLTRVLEFTLWRDERGEFSLTDDPSSDTSVDERSELFDEIRRITSILELGRRDTPDSTKH